MDVVEGFIYIIISIGLLVFLAGGGVAVAAYAVLRHLEERLMRAGLLAAGMALNFILFAQTDPSWLLIGALLIGTPMAVLVPPFLIFDRIGKDLRIFHVLICYVLVAVPGILLPFGLIASGLSMIPFISWHTTLSSGLIYLGLMLADIAVATAIYLLINGISAVLRRPSSAAR